MILYIKKLFFYIFLFVPRKLKFLHLSFSQSAEDMILLSLCGPRRDGFFIDVGAYHPVSLSNTYHFYLKGWRGINIDARPGSMREFNILRPGDINLETGISDQRRYEMKVKTATGIFFRLIQ